MTADSIEQDILKYNKNEHIRYLMDEKFLDKEKKCILCNQHMKFCCYNRNIDGYAWRCMTIKCKNYTKYFSLRLGSFFEGFNTDLKYVLRIIIKYSCQSQRYVIANSLDISETVIFLVLKKLVSLIPFTCYENNKLGGPQSIVQIDETMLNYKCKSHRGRSPTNKSDALCIVEFKDKIVRVFACLINDKKSSTLIPIIVKQVASGTKIWTDEHRSYNVLQSFNFLHETVCHKYEFVTEEGVNTQAVESFNNCLKYEIKKRKGVMTTNREDFLREFVFIYNNKNDLLEKLFRIIKIVN